MNFSEGSYYKLQKDYYEHIKLECTYVEGNTVWLIHRFNCVDPSGADSVHYKLDRKTNKLYKLNVAYSSWDTVENTLSEYGAEDIWSKRTGVESYHYDGSEQ